MKSFSDIRSIVATRNGNIFVLDFKAQQIRVFDASGKFVKLAARDGSGPGEIRNANGLAVGDNDVVWVNDPSNGRFSLYKADGSFAKQVLLLNSGFSYIWGGVIDAQGRALDPFFVVVGDKADYKTRIVSEAGTADTFPRHTCVGTPVVKGSLRFQRGDGRGTMNMGVPFQPFSQFKLTRSGEAWCTPSNEYRLWVGPVTGANREIVSLKIDPPLVSDAERKREVDRIDSIVKNYGPLREGDASLIPRTKPVIADVQVDDASRVWVRLTASPDSLPVYDVFDTKGNMVARVRGKGKINPWITTISGGYLYTSQLDDNDVPSVVRYRIVK
jgi:hypothetical protein